MIEAILPDWRVSPRVRALVTTRAGGVSAGPWASLNLGLACGDDAARVLENRRRLGVGLPASPAWLRQVHGTTVVDAAAAADAESPLEADAALARAPGQVCAVQAADCMPVLLAERDAETVAAAHAGWRGLCSGVIEATVSAMAIDPARVCAWLGPAIGPAAYEVGDEVRAAFLARDAAASVAFRVSRPGHWWLDLYVIARQRLAACGVSDVSGGGFCTHGDPGRFFSYRREGVTGRMAALVWID
ncbi:MAG: peptidoglycan editing factor PgeF [Proteobacteria bacterium]|nr:peptidoglycan editing factor PgeF [Pseudomonadota bacterium]